MDALLKNCGLYDKYRKTFDQEGLTLERFEKLISLNHSLIMTQFLDKCQMTCGEFIDLMACWESLQSKPVRQDLNLKKAPNSDRDPYLTPTQS